MPAADLIAPSRARRVPGHPQTEVIRLSRVLLNRDNIAAVADRSEESFGHQVPELVYAAVMEWVNAYHVAEEEPLFAHEWQALTTAVGDPDIAAWLLARGLARGFLPPEDQ